jgi:hypothetical protein
MGIPNAILEKRIPEEFPLIPDLGNSRFGNSPPLIMMACLAIDISKEYHICGENQRKRKAQSQLEWHSFVKLSNYR